MQPTDANRNLETLTNYAFQIAIAPTGQAFRQNLEQLVPQTGVYFGPQAEEKKNELLQLVSRVDSDPTPSGFLGIKADAVTLLGTGSYASSGSMAQLEAARVAIAGSNGALTALLKQLGILSKEEKPAAGKLINVAKAELEAKLAERRGELELKAALPKEPTDFTLPGRRRPLGKLHPLTQTVEDIVRAFRKIGFAVADGPEIEDEYHCFDALNTPADHPARDSQDTFYVSTANRPLLRTHTSSVQIRVMKSQPPPIRIVVPGRVFRRDNADATHNPTFHQIEGLYVDKGVTVSDLKGTVEFVFKELMGSDTKIRFRPHYFSYTEPSLEIDFQNALVKKMGKEWLEIAGCGMVHPQVFENVGYDPEVWSGWAFGFGVERIAMLRGGINDIRLFYENDARFLRQF